MKTSAFEDSVSGRLPRLSRLAALVVVLIGGVVLAGWALNSPALIRLLPTTIAMNPVTAANFVLAGIALWRLAGAPASAWLGSNVAPKPAKAGAPTAATVGARSARTGSLSRDPLALALAGVVALVGALRLADYVVGLPFHVDQLLFPAKLALAGAGIYPPGEMAPNTAGCFLFCGLALLLIDAESRREFRPAQALILAVGLIALLALVGYSYRVLLLYRVGLALPMSLDTAILFALFCLGFLAARPQEGLMTIITSRTTGGAMARRLLPMAILVPWILGALLLVGEMSGMYGKEFTVSIFAVASIVIFTMSLWFNAKLLYLADRERERAERRVAAQHNATRVLAETPEPAIALPRILQAVCEALGWQVGAFWQVEAQTDSLRCTEVWLAEPAGVAREFVEASRRAAFRKGQALPGRVWAQAQPVWITDKAQDSTLPRAGLAAQAGLHGAFGFPIRLGQEIFGVMEFFSREIEPADAALLEMLTAVGSQVGLFIERTRAEQQLRQTSANLQRSNTDLQQFAYVASHDLFEPLRMITSYIQLLRERAGSRLDPTSLEFIAFALDGAQRMEALIHDLLAYSRVDSRGRSFQPTDAEQVLKAALANLKVAIEERGATVTHGPLPTVRADSVQLTQVFQNLVGNAMKFHGAQPPVIEVGAERRDSEWVFHVRDNGIGIDPKYFERIFVIFQRLHTRQEYAGTGIGLAICKKIIERHGGRIWVESAPGQGATFFFSLPVAAEA